MSDVDPHGLFGDLDDPTPPAYGADLLPGVLHRGHQIRRQRRTAYAIGSTCAVVLIAGAAVGVTAGSNNNGRPVPSLSAGPSATPTHSKKPHHPSTPATTGGVVGGSHGHGHSAPPPGCATPTATGTTSPTPTDSDTPTSSPTPTESPADSAPPTATPTPTDTSCSSSTPTATPTETPTATPTSSETRPPSMLRS